MEKLKSCPFCGGEAQVETILLENNDEAWRIGCPKCGATSAEPKWDVGIAIIAWNMRTNEQRKPEVHGRWIYFTKETDEGCDTWRCSVCGARFVTEFGFEEQDFCPNCGARMDGGEGE